MNSAYIASITPMIKGTIGGVIAFCVLYYCLDIDHFRQSEDLRSFFQFIFEICHLYSLGFHWLYVMLIKKQILLGSRTVTVMLVLTNGIN